MPGKYDSYIRTVHNLGTKLADAYPDALGQVIAENMRLGKNMVLALRLIDEVETWVHPAHCHDYREYLAWYGADPQNPDDFDADIEFHIGEEMEQHIITQPAIVSLPPGLTHCPMKVTRLGKPIIQVAITLKVDTD